MVLMAGRFYPEGQGLAGPAHITTKIKLWDPVKCAFVDCIKMCVLFIGQFNGHTLSSNLLPQIYQNLIFD